MVGLGHWAFLPSPLICLGCGSYTQTLLNSLLGFLKEHHGFKRFIQIISDDMLSF